MPIENSTEGTVNHTLDRFLTSPLKICGEVELRIRHYLMGNMGAPRAHRARLLAPAVARAVPRLAAGAPAERRARAGIEQRRGARAARATSSGTAAIAGETAAEVYGLKVLAAEIEDRADNTTRFLVLGRKLLAASGAGPHHAAGVGRRTPMHPARSIGCSSLSRAIASA